MTQEAPLEIILRDVQRALDARLWYAALAVSLSLPDICSLLELPADQNWSKGWKYAGWFDRNLPHYLPSFTGKDCYELRGGILHNGRVRRDESRWNYIGFTTPDSPIRMHRCISANNGGEDERVYVLDAAHFCGDMLQAVRNWFTRSKDDPNVQANLPSLIALRRDDIGRQISGLEMLR